MYKQLQSSWMTERGFSESEIKRHWEEIESAANAPKVHAESVKAEAERRVAEKYDCSIEAARYIIENGKT